MEIEELKIIEMGIDRKSAFSLNSFTEGVCRLLFLFFYFLISDDTSCGVLGDRYMEWRFEGGRKFLKFGMLSLGMAFRSLFPILEK